VTPDAICDAIRAEAEAAREVIRATGMDCPSCGVNMADLPDEHFLILSLEGGGEPWCECRDGAQVILGPSKPFKIVHAAGNIAVWDAFRFRQMQAFRKLTGL
jgi:bacterioferritin-associated ferredoxin